MTDSIGSRNPMLSVRREFRSTALRMTVSGRIAFAIA